MTSLFSSEYYKSLKDHFVFYHLFGWIQISQITRKGGKGPVVANCWIDRTDPPSSSVFEKREGIAFLISGLYTCFYETLAEERRNIGYGGGVFDRRAPPCCFT